MKQKTFPTSNVIESLEAKLAPAGTVVLTIAGGILTITGDGADNGIHITDDPLNGQWDITDALAGTNFVVNGVVQAAPFSIQAQQGIKATLGNGNDSIIIAGSNTDSGFLLPKGININSGEGNDNLDIGTSSSQNLIIGGAFQINMGGGNDAFDFSSSGTILAPVKILAGAGDDNVDFDGSNTQILTKGLNVDLGTGDDDFDIISSSFSLTGGSFIVKAAGGIGTSPTLSLGSTGFAAAGSVSITVLAGDASIDIGNGSTDVMHFGAGLKVIGGAGNDLVTFDSQMQSSGAVSVDLKAGNNTLIMDDNSSLFGSTFTVKALTGDDTFHLDPGYALQLTGLFSVNLGSGANTFLTSAGTSVNVGTLSYVGTTGVDDFKVSGDTFHTNGAAKLLLGDGANLLDLSPTTSLFVGGALSITSLNGADNIDINTPLANVLGTLTFKLGSGNNDVDLLGASLRVGGALSYAGGIDGDNLDSNNGELFVQRAVTFSGSAGSNVLYLRPGTGSVGSVNYIGTTGLDGIGLGNTDGVSTTNFKVNGNFLANQSTGLGQLYVTDTVLQGNFTFISADKAGESMHLQFNQSVFNGNVTVTEGAGNSLNLLNDMIVRGNFSLNTGAGDNQIGVDNSGATTSLSRWFGTVKIIAGAGNDTVLLGSNPVVANAGNVFYKHVTVNLGTGTDSFTQGNNTFVDGSTLP